MILSENLSVAEFSRSDTAKRRGIDNTPKSIHLEAAKELAKNIFQPIREHFNTPIFISSGYRSEALNKAIKGSATSQPSKGEAIDIDMDGYKGPTNAEVFTYIRENLNFDQLGLSIIVANPVAYTVTADSAIRTGQVYGETRTKVNTLTVSRSTSPGTFTFSSDDKGGLTLSGTINGSPVSQRIQLSDGTGNQMQYNFSQFGVTLGITNLNFDTAAQIAQSLSSLPNNTITVEAAIDSAKTVASKIDGKNIIVTGGASALQQYGLTAANFVSVAPANPLDYMNGSTPYISAESANQVQRLSSVLGNSVADLVTDVGVQINTWNNAQSADTAILKNLNEQRNQVSGVNLDEEAANLLKYQQLYSASSKVLQTGNQMFNALISIMN